MAELVEQELSNRERVRHVYVLGDVDGCPHPEAQRTYHGTQGTAAFYQCQQCDAVIVVSYGETRSAVEQSILNGEQGNDRTDLAR